MTTLGGGTAHIDVQELPPPELERRMAWHNGYLVFAGEPLSEVVEEVNRYSQISVKIADPKLSSIAIGARFRVGELDSVLEVLHDNFGIQYTRPDEHTTVLQGSAPK